MYGDFLLTLRFDWRNTGLGGLTLSMVICLTCMKVLQPTSIYRSRRGTHGEDSYTHYHGHDIQYCTLLRSNSGRRRLEYSSGFPSRLVDFLRVQWLDLGQIPEHDELEKMLGEKAGQMTEDTSQQ